MTTIFRLGTAEDIADCVALLKQEDCFNAPQRVWESMPGAWAKGLATESLTFLVYEDLNAKPDQRLVSCGLSVMVSDEFAALLRAGAGPWAAQLLYTEAGFDSRYVLGRREIARANARRSLNLFVLHNPLRYRDPNDEKLAKIMPVGLAGFQYAHDGYNLQRLIWEVYGESLANVLLSTGYRLLDPFNNSAPANALPSSKRPMLVARLREDSTEPGYNADQMMLSSYTVPRLGLTPAQQRLVKLALLEYDEHELERVLGISRNAIKQSWRGIYERTKEALPHAFADTEDPARRVSQRRAVLSYLRQHMEELRPFERRMQPGDVAQTGA
jgi:hypothetical protein